MAELEHGSKPAMRQEHWQGIRPREANVQEVDIAAIDGSGVLRSGIQESFTAAPVVFG